MDNYRFTPRASDNLALDQSKMSKDLGAGDPETWLDEHGDVMFRYAMMRVRDSLVVDGQSY